MCIYRIYTQNTCISCIEYVLNMYIINTEYMYKEICVCILGFC